MRAALKFLRSLTWQDDIEPALFLAFVLTLIAFFVGSLGWILYTYLQFAASIGATP